MYSLQETNKTLRVLMSSDMLLIDHAIRDTTSFISRTGTKDCSEFKIILRELLANAIEHGNRLDTHKNVVCEITPFSRDRIKIAVEDEGNGFDCQGIDLSLPDDPSQTRQRGLPLVNAYAEGLNFLKQGSRVEALLLLSSYSTECSKDEKGIVLTPSGNITAATVDRFCEDIAVLEDEGDRLYFDFRNVEEVDSLGLSALLVFAKASLKKKPSLHLEIQNLSPSLTKMFQLTRMDKIYHMS